MNNTSMILQTCLKRRRRSFYINHINIHNIFKYSTVTTTTSNSSTKSSSRDDNNKNNKKDNIFSNIELLACSTSELIISDLEKISSEALLSAINAKMDQDEIVTKENFAPWIGSHWIHTIGHYVHGRARGRGFDPTGDVEQGVIMTIDARYKEAIEKSFFRRKEISLKKDVMDAFIKLKQQQHNNNNNNLKIGLTSNTLPKIIQEYLYEKLNITNQIDGFISSQDIFGGTGMGPVYSVDSGNNNPNQDEFNQERRELLKSITPEAKPDVVIGLINKLNIKDPSKCARIGSTVRDIEEGKKAKCGIVIGISEDDNICKDMEATGADYTFKSIKDLF